MFEKSHEFHLFFEVQHLWKILSSAKVCDGSFGQNWMFILLFDILCIVVNVLCPDIGKTYKYNDITQYFLKFNSLNKITTHWHSANGHLLLLRHFRISTFYPFPMSFYGFITSPIFVLEKFRKWWAQLFISGVVKNQFQVCPQIQYLAALFHLWNFLCKSTFFNCVQLFTPK